MQREDIQRVGDEFAQHGLRQSCGGRVDGREALLQRRVLSRRAAFRMHHLQPVIAHARLADGAYVAAHRELLLLAGIEIQKAQRQLAAAVPQAAHQGAARTKSHLAMRDDALHLRRRTGLHGIDGGKLRLVFIAQRQMQQQIAAVMDTELGEFRQGCRGDFGGCAQVNA